MAQPLVDLSRVSGEPADAGQSMHELAARLFPICRSITGPGVRETLRILSGAHSHPGPRGAIRDAGL
jgi:aminopeptidase-like protein